MKDDKASGYFGIGIDHCKKVENIGTLWRSAHILGASFIFTIGKRYKRQSADTLKTWQDIPLYHYETAEDFKKAIPFGCQVIGIELDPSSTPLQTFEHPDRCIYLLGAEDHGFTNDAFNVCHKLVQLPGEKCLNVATAGSIVMYDRIAKINLNSQ